VLGIFVSVQVNAADTLLVSGPVESIDFAQQSVVILGQPIRLSSRTSYFVGSVENAASASRVDQRAVRLFGGGRVVAVWSNDGTNATAVLISRERFVPGSTQVFLAGVVTAVDQSRGYATVGHTQVDLTAALYRGSLDVSTGDTLRVIGTQPVPAGVIVGSDFEVVRLNGIGGSSTSGIGGSSTSGIGGSSTSGIGGSSTSGIGGSSTSGIGGSSTSGIGGSSTSGIGGSSTSGIGGSSTSGIGGSSTSGIGGSSTSGIGGSSTSGIGGSSITKASGI
jgi:hypothetical protein